MVIKSCAQYLPTSIFHYNNNLLQLLDEIASIYIFIKSLWGVKTQNSDFTQIWDVPHSL